MIVYHGSYLEIPTPDSLHSRKTLTLDAVFTQHRFMTKLQNGVRNSNDVERMELFPVIASMKQPFRDLKF